MTDDAPCSGDFRQQNANTFRRIPSCSITSRIDGEFTVFMLEHEADRPLEDGFAHAFLSFRLLRIAREGDKFVAC